MSIWSWLGELFGRRRPPEQRVVSLVLLLREERYLDVEILGRLAERALEVEFDDSEDPENFVVMIKDDVNYMIRARGEMFLVNNYPCPYVDDVKQVGDEIQELRLRQAFLEHRAWLSVDRFGPPSLSDDEAFRWIGRLVAELLDEDCTAIFCPTNRRGCVREEDHEEILRGPDPLQIFQTSHRPPVVGVSDNDAEMARAVQAARERWPEFTAAFEQRGAGDVFSVKAPISVGGATEYMWLSVGALENGIVYGRLDNDPVCAGKIKAGDRVRVPVNEVNDWLYVAGDQQCGGFTVAILMAKQQRKEKP